MKKEADFIETIFNSSRAKKAFNALGILGTLKNLHVKYIVVMGTFVKNVREGGDFMVVPGSSLRL